MIIPGQYKNNPAGWSVALAGKDCGIATGPQGQQLPLDEFLAWSYGVPLEEAQADMIRIIQSSTLPVPPGSGKCSYQLGKLDLDPEHVYVGPLTPKICSGPIQFEDRVWFGQKPTDPIGQAVEQILGKTRVYDGLTDVTKP